MSAQKKTAELRFEGVSRSLRDAQKKARDEFPLLVKTKGQCDFRDKFKENCDKLPNGELMLIEKVETIEYALVRVLKYHSENKAMSEKGGDFVLEHNNYENFQFLVPLGYKGTVRLAHPPGCRESYACVPKVIEDLPQYLIVNVDTEAMTSDIKPKIVSSGHRLTVCGDVKVSNKTYLKCTDDNDEIFLFKESAFVNFTAKYSSEKMTLSTVSKTPLPKCIVFDNVDYDDVVLENEEEAMTATLVVSGPLMMLKVKKQIVLVAWLRDKEKKSFRIVLIPEGLWDIENVQLATFPKLDRQYIDSSFPTCKDSSVILNKFYLRTDNKTKLTYLKIPSSSSDNFPQDFSPDEYPDSDDYEIPEPPSSPSPNIQTTGSLSSSIPKSKSQSKAPVPLPRKHKKLQKKSQKKPEDEQQQHRSQHKQQKQTHDNISPASQATTITEQNKSLLSRAMSTTKKLIAKVKPRLKSESETETKTRPQLLRSQSEPQGVDTTEPPRRPRRLVEVPSRDSESYRPESSQNNYDDLDEDSMLDFLPNLSSTSTALPPVIGASSLDLSNSSSSDTPRSSSLASSRSKFTNKCITKL